MQCINRYPAIPLFVHDPYFSIWSVQDHLNEGWSRHWTGSGHTFAVLLRIDGIVWKIAGDVPNTQTAEQKLCRVYATTTKYIFQAGDIEITLNFVSPLLPDDLMLLSRPISYLCYSVKSLSEQPHKIELYVNFDNNICVNDCSQPTTWGRFNLEGMDVMSFSAAEQKPLNRAGDDLRIDWGTFYLGLPHTNGTMTSAIAPNHELWQEFSSYGKLLRNDDMTMPKPPTPFCHTLGAAIDLGTVSTKEHDGYFLVAYDSRESISYLNCPLYGYWAKDGENIGTILLDAMRRHAKILTLSAEFDHDFEKRFSRVGGNFYAELNALAYRQTIGAHKLVADFNGNPLFFSKENFSNGCIATVDVTYPSAPLFVAFAPALLKAMLIPILDYAKRPRWRFPFAPHDLGCYPLANGQVYGGGERNESDQMPVEECGNMLLLVTMLGKFNEDWSCSEQYYELLKDWADYLLDKGYDPENQLCTDDFAGHLAHNANLSIKALLAIAAFAEIAEHNGRDGSIYRHAAEKGAEQWLQDSRSNDSAHTVLAFNAKNTWSMKYNLVWDKLLNLHLFPEELAQQEVTFYLQQANQYGIPLDNRANYTKLDWLVWSATLSGKRVDFDAVLTLIGNFLRDTPDRVPLTDWYDTKDAHCINFRARSVVGGLAIALLFQQRQEK